MSRSQSWVPRVWVYVRFPPNIPGCWPHVQESIMGPKGLGLYEISTLDTWLLAPCPGINHGSREFGFVWDFHPTYLAVGPMSRYQSWVPRIWVYVRFPPYIPGCWPHVQEPIMGPEGLGLCEISTLHTWLLAPCPGINHGSRGFGFLWDFRLPLLLLFVQLSTWSAVTAIVWSAMSIATVTRQQFHTTVILPRIP